MTGRQERKHEQSVYDGTLRSLDSFTTPRYFLRGQRAAKHQRLSSTLEPARQKIEKFEEICKKHESTGSLLPHVRLSWGFGCYSCHGQRVPRLKYALVLHTLWRFQALEQSLRWRYSDMLYALRIRMLEFLLSWRWFVVVVLTVPLQVSPPSSQVCSNFFASTTRRGRQFRCPHSMKSWACPVTLTKQIWKRHSEKRLWNSTRTSIHLRNSKCGQRNFSTFKSSWRHLKMNKVDMFMMRFIFTRSGQIESLSWWIWMEACCASWIRMEEMATRNVLSGLTSVTRTTRFGCVLMPGSSWSLSCTQPQRWRSPYTQAAKWEMLFHRWPCCSTASIVQIYKTKCLQSLLVMNSQSLIQMLAHTSPSAVCLGFGEIREHAQQGASSLMLATQ